MYNTINPDDIKLHGNGTFPKWVPVRERFTSLSYERGQAFLFSLKTHSKVARLYMGSRQWRCSQSSLIDGHEYAVAHAQLSNGLAEIVFLSLIASQNIQSRLKADPTDRKLFPAAFLAVSRGISIDPRPGYTGFVFALCWKIIFERKGRGFSLSRYRKGRGEGIIEPISSYSRNYFQTEDYIFSLVVFNVEKILKILLAP